MHVVFYYATKSLQNQALTPILVLLLVGYGYG